MIDRSSGYLSILPSTSSSTIANSNANADEPETELAWPPPPHDPREREALFRVEGWEVRFFGSPKFEYFVSRGFWHLQLWHPEERISILSPSRLTKGFYEAYPFANWKIQSQTYEGLVSILTGVVRPPFVDAARMKTLERCLVDDVVRLSLAPANAAAASSMQ